MIGFIHTKCLFCSKLTIMKRLLLLLCLTPLFSFSQCFMSFLGTTVGPADVNNQYQVTIDIQFSNAPATGSIVLEVDDGITVYDTLLALPFVSPTNGSTISFLPANGNSCTVNAYFSDLPSCSISSNYTSPLGYNCVADAGTYTETITGNSFLNGVLTWGDQLDLTSNGDNVFHDELTSFPSMTYAPGIGYLVFSCPPYQLTGGVSSDSCLIGLAGIGNNLYDINNPSSIYYSIPPGDITNNTIYYVPLTFYDTVGLTIAVSNSGGPMCYDFGEVFPITYLDSIWMSANPNPTNGTCNFTMSGAYPALNGSNFTVSDILPATAIPDQTTVANNGSFTLSGLQDGQIYSFKITDDAGSVKYVNQMYLDINEFSLNDFTVFPNPFNEEIIVSGVNDFIKGQLRDSQGRVIATINQQEELVFKTKDLAPGYYFIDVHHNGQIYSKAVVKQ